MTHLYARAVLERVLPLLHRERFRAVPWETIANALGIPTSWVGQAVAELVEAGYLEAQKTTEGHSEYRPNLEHQELAGLF